MVTLEDYVYEGTGLNQHWLQGSVPDIGGFASCRQTNGEEGSKPLRTKVWLRGVSVLYISLPCCNLHRPKRQFLLLIYVLVLISHVRCRMHFYVVIIYNILYLVIRQLNTGQLNLFSFGLFQFACISVWSGYVKEDLHYSSVFLLSYWPTVMSFHKQASVLH